MAGRRRRDQGNSGVHAFLYVLVVLVLLGGMGYLFYYSRSQASERQEYIRELESKEAATKGQVQTWSEEPESESEVETETAKETEAETESESEIESQSQLESESEIESETETETGTETEVDADTKTQMQTQTPSSSGVTSTSKSRTVSITESQSIGEESAESTEEVSFSAENPRIIVLNGTGKAGVAAYWKRFLQGKGLTNIVMADYKGEISDHTVVYVTAGGDAPEGVYNLFPNAEYREGGLDSVDPDADTNVKIPDSQKKFDSYDVWIVVGKDDALHD